METSSYAPPTVPSLQHPETIGEFGAASSHPIVLPCQEDSRACEELGSNNGRSMGLGVRFRIPVGAHRETNTALHSTFKNKYYRDRPDQFGSAGVTGKRSHSTGGRQGEPRLLFETVPRTQERWTIQTCNKSQATEQVDSIQPFQDGRDPRGKRPTSQRGLHDSDRPERCLSGDPNTSTIPPIPALPLGRPGLRVLPFGLASAPRVFTKVMRAVVTFLRNRGIRCVIYLDDLLLMNKSPSTLKEHTTLTLDLLEALGFLVNYPKSHLTPSQEMEYLGFLIDSTQKKLRLPKAKLDQIRTEASQILTSKETSARHLAQLIGKMSAAILAIYPAPLHYRSLQALKHKALARCGYDGHITLSEEAKVDLRWWTNNLT